MLVSAIKSSNAAQDNLKDMMKAMERDCTIHRSHLQAAIAERDDRDVKLMHLKAELGTEDFGSFDETKQAKLYVIVSETYS
jgi:hypothetical protein